MRPVAALYVQRGGCYFDLAGVDPWDVSRDARTYAGPYPVVAHPPCERWGKFWWGSLSHPQRYQLGDDGGCFAAALDAVRRWGGVLEHPHASQAWSAFGLMIPPVEGGWVSAGMFDPGWTCSVEQGAYGHPSRKSSWLYACHVDLPSLRWSTGGPKARKAVPAPEKPVTHLSARQRIATPLPFRDLLLSIARSARPAVEAA